MRHSLGLRPRTVTHAWRKCLAQPPLRRLLAAQVGLPEHAAGCGPEELSQRGGNVGVSARREVRTAALEAVSSERVRSCLGCLLMQAGNDKLVVRKQAFSAQAPRSLREKRLLRFSVEMNRLPSEKAAPVEWIAECMHGACAGVVGPTLRPQALPGPVLARGKECREPREFASRGENRGSSPSTRRPAKELLGLHWLRTASLKELPQSRSSAARRSCQHR